ncbi:hypothetical protein ES705_39738 [subsurface metagenome]
MQEIMEDGSEGKCFVEDSIEDLVPHIKKSLSDPNVKFIKVYKTKALIAVGINHIKKQDKFLAEEDKVDVGESILESLKEEEGK